MPDRIDDLTNGWSPQDDHILDTLANATVERLRLLQDSSNYVFLADLVHPEHGAGLGVYKPERGERPLADFVEGTLHRREVAAFEFSRLLGWDIIPPTVECDGSEGPGSMQLFVEHSPRDHYFALRDRSELHEQFVRFACFDLLANNADRKGGHLLLGADDRLWGIDNALCFHAVEKLRTVIWDFAGREIPGHWIEDIDRVRGCLAMSDDSTAALRRLLTQAEVEALAARCSDMVDGPVLPEMYTWRCVPWPLI